MFVFKLSTEIYWVAEVHGRRDEELNIKQNCDDVHLLKKERENKKNLIFILPNQK